MNENDNPIERLPSLSRISEKIYKIVEREIERLVRKSREDKGLDAFDIRQLQALAGITTDLSREERELLKQMKEMSTDELKALLKKFLEPKAKELPGEQEARESERRLPVIVRKAGQRDGDSH